MQPHQIRVVEEKDQLDDRLGKLRAFFGVDRFESLPMAEQTRMRCQEVFMSGYSRMLGERIAAFPEAG